MIDTFLQILTHLLPNARAWHITVDKTLRKFFEGLAPIGVDIKLYYDLILYDILPSATRELALWEQQFGLISYGLTEQQRRDRLGRTWKTLGGQDPFYIQSTLQANGFDVYVHEWWVPASKPAVNSSVAATPRNPFSYLREDTGIIVYLVECGEALAQCGETLAQAGESNTPSGYALVNKIVAPIQDPLALSYYESPVEYNIPLDPNTWPYFLYIGGETFGTLATVDPKRKDEFEDLCLKICPTQQWLGILVTYT
jgi:hypothetical protein